MTAVYTELNGVIILKSDLIHDKRGFKETTLSSEEMSGLGVDFKCKQQNIYHAPEIGTFYGIHFQEKKHSQAKLIYCIQGRGIDYVVDLRKDSPTYKKWISIEISEKDGLHIYIPQGFGHAFLTLEDDTKQLFSVDEYFFKESSKKIRFDDKDLNIKYPIPIHYMSDSDASAPTLKECIFRV